MPTTPLRDDTTSLSYLKNKTNDLNIQRKGANIFTVTRFNYVNFVIVFNPTFAYNFNKTCR